jgi:hypothetical protein
MEDISDFVALGLGVTFRRVEVRVAASDRHHLSPPTEGRRSEADAQHPDR